MKRNSVPKEQECDRMKKKISILAVIAVLLASWVSIAYSDYAKVAISFDKPKFCVLINGADDGGSGKYIGLGYSFIVDGDNNEIHYVTALNQNEAHFIKYSG